MKLYDVFISYRRDDGSELAKQLYTYLVGMGLRVFLDTQEMIDGHYFTTQIEDNLRRAPNYVLIGTPSVLVRRPDEDWVHREIEIALEEYDANPTQRSICVLVPQLNYFPSDKSQPDTIRKLSRLQQIPLNADPKQEKAFGKILNAVTAVNRCNLWYAANRWLEYVQKKNRRFSGLNIVQNLFPQVDMHRETAQMSIYVQDQKDSAQHTELMQAIGESADHAYLIGEGGIGKTTAMMHIMRMAYENKAYNDHSQIPVFVELSYAPDTYGELYKEGKSSFIRRSIYKLLRNDLTFKQVAARQISDIDEVFSIPPDVAVQPINDLFSQEKPAPEYLLLLDGLNEVSTVTIAQTDCTVAEMIIGEIDMLMSEFPNVRVILTSRSDELVIRNHQLKRFYLTGVENDAVGKYLVEHHFTEDKISEITNDSALMRVLKVPLFLTMYATLNKRENVHTRGEILRLFFNECRDQDYLYTAQNRWAQTARDVSSAASAIQKKRISSAMNAFILDFILPEIAWEMERNGNYYLKAEKIMDMILPVLASREDTAVCGKYGRDLFEKYSLGGVRNHTRAVADQWLALEADPEEVAETILECCTKSLGILHRGQRRTYGFVHQHIRDYFAAVKYINTLQMAVYLNEEVSQASAIAHMNLCFRDTPVHMTVRQLIGEALGEHHNQPKLRGSKFDYGVPEEPQDRNLIDRALHIYRGCFDEHDAIFKKMLQVRDKSDLERLMAMWRDNDRKSNGYGVYNLLKIVAETRKVLAGIDLSNLDLTRCQLNGVTLCRKGLPAKISGAKIKGNLFMSGHTDGITSLAFSPDGQRILSSSYDGTEKMWDAQSGELMTSSECENHVYCAGYTHDGSRIVTVSKYDPDNRESKMFMASQVRLQIYDAKDHRWLTDAIIQGDVKAAVLSPDGAYLLLKGVASFRVVSLESMEVIYTQTVDYSRFSSIQFVDFYGEDTLVWGAHTVSGDTKVEVIDVLRKTCVHTLEVENKITGFAKHPVRPEGIVSGKDKAFRTFCRLIDTDTGETIQELDLPAGWGITAGYSPSGKWLACHSGDWLMLYDTKEYRLQNKISCDYGLFAFDASENRIVTRDCANAIYVYHVTEPECLMRIDGMMFRNIAAAISPDSDWVAACSGDGKLRLWNKRTGKLENQVEIDGRKIYFHGDGTKIFVESTGVTYCLSVPSLEILKQFPEHMYCSTDYRYYWCWDRDCVSIYQMADDALICRIEEAANITVCGDVAMIRFGENDEWPCWEFYDLISGKLLRGLGNELEVAMSEQYIASYSDERKLLIRTVEGLREFADTYDIAGDQGEGQKLMFSKGGDYLLEVSHDHVTVRRTHDMEILCSKELPDVNVCDIGYTRTVMAYKKHADAKRKTISVFDLVTMEYELAVYSSYKQGGVKAFTDHELLMQADHDTLYIYRVENMYGIPYLDSGKWQFCGSLMIAPGLDVWGLDLRKLHPESGFTDKQKGMLRQYGAIL